MGADTPSIRLDDPQEESISLSRYENQKSHGRNVTCVNICISGEDKVFFNRIARLVLAAGIELAVPNHHRAVIIDYKKNVVQARKVWISTARLSCSKWERIRAARDIFVRLNQVSFMYRKTRVSFNCNLKNSDHLL